MNQQSRQRRRRRQRAVGTGVTFGEVTTRADRVVIVGQGPSFARVNRGQLERVREAGATVIAVNGAVEHIEADYWFTLDPSPENQARMEDRVSGCKYVAAVPEDYATRACRLAMYRRPAPKGVLYLRRVHGKGLSVDPGSINTGNSAFGALGLAYHMGAQRIVLLGVDGKGRRRWDRSRNASLAHLPLLFATAVPQLADRWIAVGSRRSALTVWPRMTPGDALEAL